MGEGIAIIRKLILGVLSIAVLSTCGQANQEAAEVRESQELVVEQVYETNLIAGEYVIGEDFPAGNYRITFTGGNLWSNYDIRFVALLQEEANKERDENDPIRLDSYDLKEGSVFELDGNIKINIRSNKLAQSNYKKRQIGGKPNYTFQPGYFTAGVDFEPGIYNVVWSHGQGMITVTRNNETVVNDYFTGIPDQGVQEYRNIRFDEGSAIYSEQAVFKLSQSE